MTISKFLTIFALCIFIPFSINAPQLTQRIRGIVIDEASSQPLSFVNVAILDTPMKQQPIA